MPWTDADIRANRDYFAAKLRAEKQRDEVLKAVESKSQDFVLLDTRARDAFEFGHIPGAWCVPLAELETVLPQLSREKKIVAYCWGHD